MPAAPKQKQSLAADVPPGLGLDAILASIAEIEALQSLKPRPKLAGGLNATIGPRKPSQLPADVLARALFGAESFREGGAGTNFQALLSALAPGMLSEQKPDPVVEMLLSAIPFGPGPVSKELKAFHGSPRPGISRFATRPAELGSSTGARTAKLGAFFSESMDVATAGAYRFNPSPLQIFDPAFKPTIYEATLNLKKPLNLSRMTQAEIRKLESRFPGFEKVYRGSKDKFEVVQFLSQQQRGGKAIPQENFVSWAKRLYKMPEDEARRVFNTGDPRFLAYRKAQDTAFASSNLVREPIAQKALREMGYDGIMVRTKMDAPPGEGPLHQYVVFNPEGITVDREVDFIEEVTKKAEKK